MNVTILNQSLNVATGDKITSFLLEGFPYDVLAEFNKHRLFSANCESSRARKFSTVLRQVTDDPFIPTFTREQPGMQGWEHEEQEELKNIYLKARDVAVTQAILLDSKEVHKQDINGLLKPWLKVSQIVTATSWDNFFKLRRAPGAKPAIREFADEMFSQYQQSSATNLNVGDWHLPYPQLGFRENVAKCASISYANHRKDSSTEDLIRLHARLISQGDLSPSEHCAMAVKPGTVLIGEDGWKLQVFDHFKPLDSSRECDPKQTQVSVGNFSGFLQYRKFLENNIVAGDYDGFERLKSI